MKPHLTSDARLLVNGEDIKLDQLKIEWVFEERSGGEKEWVFWRTKQRAEHSVSDAFSSSWKKVNKRFNSTDFQVNTKVNGRLALDTSSIFDCFRGRTVIAVTSKVSNSSPPLVCGCASGVSCGFIYYRDSTLIKIVGMAVSRRLVIVRSDLSKCVGYWLLPKKLQPRWKDVGNGYEI